MDYLAANNLSKLRGYVEIVENLTFRVNAGQLLWLRGPNGSGKTTVLRILSGLSQASSGSIESKLNKQFYISHQQNLIDCLSVEDTVKRYFPLLGLSRNDECSQQLALSGLHDSRYLRVSQLSAGQKQRLKLLPLLLESRTLWLLDEPYSNLDTQGRAWLNNLVTEHTANAGIVIMTHHAEQLDLNANIILNLGDSVSD